MTAAEVAELVAMLERERFNEGQGGELEQGYRRGWNERARTLLELLRAKR